MEIQIFNKMFNDKHSGNLKKMQYKYPDDFTDFIEALKNYYFHPLPVKDFDGNPLVLIENKAVVNMSGYRLLLSNRGKRMSEKSVEEEIISTAKIESIDYSRESVRNILKGFAPKDDIEDRILGMKKGFDFISDKSNRITEDNIYKLYMTAIGNFLDDKNKLLNGNTYRHDAVHIQTLSGDVSHTGMHHSGLPQAMKELVCFINTNDGMNELVKAAVIHFYVAYLHPYFDGNGRMARLIHLWYLIQCGFDSTLFIPFSSYIIKTAGKYYDAYSTVESNSKISGVIDVTPFVTYFAENVYNAFESNEIGIDVFGKFNDSLNTGVITDKENELWKFVVANYGENEFSTKQLEKDCGFAAYATIRAFVLKFEGLGLLSSRNFSNRVKYRIKA